MLIHKAIEFAAIRHKDQKRKGTELPYIVHPMEVMQILTENGCDEIVIVAGILHDTIEDTETTYDDILENFGKEIADIVASESEDKSKSWKERKQTTIDRLTECREWDKEAPCPFNQVSTGVLFCRPPHQSTEQILHQVDELMYQNKMKKHTRTS